MRDQWFPIICSLSMMYYDCSIGTLSSIASMWCTSDQWFPVLCSLSVMYGSGLSSLVGYIYVVMYYYVSHSALVISVNIHLWADSTLAWLRIYIRD